MPSTATDRLNGVTTNVAVKAPCSAVTLTNITLAGLQGHTANDRVLVTAQTNPVDNGIYDVSSGNWTRSKDFDGNRDVTRGTRVLVAFSASSPAAEYEVTTNNPITIGTTALVFTLRYGANATYDITPAEIAAGVTPVNYSIPSHDAIGYVHLFRYLTTAQRADYEAGTLTLDLATPLQQMLDVAAGRVAHMPKGLAKTTVNLTMAAGTTLTGEGAITRIIAYDCQAISCAAFCVIEKLQIYAVDAVGADDPKTRSGVKALGTLPAPLEGIVLRDVFLRGWLQCIDLGYVVESVVDAVKTINCYSSVRYFAQCVNNKVSNSHLQVTGAGSTSINLVSDAGLTIRGEGLMVSNTFLGGGENAIRSDAAGYYSIGVDPSCIIDLLSGDGFYLPNSRSISICPQFLYTNGGHGVNFPDGGIAEKVTVDVGEMNIIAAGKSGVIWGTGNDGLKIGGHIQTYHASGGYPVIIRGTGVKHSAYIENGNSGVQGTFVDSTGNDINPIGDRTVLWNTSPVATVASVAGTIALPKNGCTAFYISGTLAITSITADGWDGQEVTLIFTSTATLTNGSNLKIGANFVATADDAIKLVCAGANWYRVAAGAVN